MFCKLFIPLSYRNHPFDGWYLINAELFSKIATIFLNLANCQKTHQIETVHTESSKIELFEGEKVFSHKIICIFVSDLTVCVLLKAVRAWRKFEGVWQWHCNKFTCMIKVPQLKKSVKNFLDISLKVWNITKTISHLSLGDYRYI